MSKDSRRNLQSLGLSNNNSKNEEKHQITSKIKHKWWISKNELKQLVKVEKPKEVENI